MYIDAQGNLSNGAAEDEEILFNYDLGRQFARRVLQKRIPNLQEYELADYFPASGEKETYLFEQYLMGGQMFNVSVEHEIIDGQSYWKLLYGRPQPGGAPGDPKALEVMYETPEIATLEKFIQHVNNDARRWDFDAW